MSVSVPPPVPIAINRNGAHEHYEGVLRDLERQLARLDLERQRIKTLIESLASFLPNKGDGGSGMPNEESGKVGEFVNMSLLQAIKRYLDREGAPQPANAIVRDLIRGGFQSDSKNFNKVVAPALYRHLKRTQGSPKSIISKFGSNWGLTKWDKIGGQQ